MNRIPAYAHPVDLIRWLDTMKEQGLLFHPDDDPADIISNTTDQPVFTDEEVILLRDQVALMWTHYGDDLYTSFMAFSGGTSPPNRTLHKSKVGQLPTWLVILSLFSTHRWLQASDVLSLLAGRGTRPSLRSIQRTLSHMEDGGWLLRHPKDTGSSFCVRRRINTEHPPLKTLIEDLSCKSLPTYPSC